MSFCGSKSNAGTDTSAPLVNVIVNNALFRSNSHINQMLLQIIPILRFCLIDSLPHIFSQLDWGLSQIWKFIGVTTIY